MTETDQNIFNQLPQPEPESPFRLLRVEDIGLPHPYCITPKHLAYADSMVLNEQAIRQAEQRGAKCDICRKLCRCGKQAQVLSWAEHTPSKTLFIEVDDNQDLNQVAGLTDYLLRIKSLAQTLGIEGFAFPNRQTGKTGRKEARR
ncbi:MAG: hypothetical protein FOGNACKC_02870 [Anaerolineae bacterium]|nr:hypothetical protein [Anaerolineae bacterium]